MVTVGTPRPCLPGTAAHARLVDVFETRDQFCMATIETAVHDRAPITTLDDGMLCLDGLHDAEPPPNILPTRYWPTTNDLPR